MKKQHHMATGIAIALTLGGLAADAQVVNTWRGGDRGEEWSNQYKWKLNHTPTGEEAAHFREGNSVISVNNTIHLSNGMHLYGEELSLQGNGNINLWSKVPHQRTVNIPASASGYANMTLNDNLSLNGRVALSAKAFATSASKGSITLKDRSNVTGDLCVGNAGVGTGRIYVRENSTYRVTGLQLQTEADKGGSAEIHIEGGTVRLETKENPFEIFLADASRKIIVGDGGTLRFEYDLSLADKKDAMKRMIIQDNIVAAPGCRLTTPIIQDKMAVIRAVDERDASELLSEEQLLAAIDALEANAMLAEAEMEQPQQLESLLRTMRVANDAPVVTTPSTETVAAAENVLEEERADGRKTGSYVAFFGVVMLVLRRAKQDDESLKEADEK